MTIENTNNEAAAEFIADVVANDNKTVTPIPAGYDLRVLQSLRRVIRSVDLYSRKLLNVHKITSPQLICLQVIASKQPMTTGQLAKEVHLSPSTVIGILDRLQAKNLILRERDTKDRRKVFVSLAEQGQQLLNNAPSPLQDTLADAMQALPESEQKVIADSLDRIVEMMEVKHIEASPILETGAIQPANEEL